MLLRKNPVGGWTNPLSNWITSPRDPGENEGFILIEANLKANQTLQPSRLTAGSPTAITQEKKGKRHLNQTSMRIHVPCKSNLPERIMKISKLVVCVFECLINKARGNFSFFIQLSLSASTSTTTWNYFPPSWGHFTKNVRRRRNFSVMNILGQGFTLQRGGGTTPWPENMWKFQCKIKGG